MARLTYEEKQAKLETERAARKAAEQTKKVAEFRRRVASERGKRTYEDRVALAAEDTGDRSSMALYEMVHEHQRVTKSLTKHCEEVQRRMADALRGLADNSDASWYSHMIGSVAFDMEQEMAQRKELAMSISRLAWATNWYVPHVLSQRAREQHDQLVAVDVRQDMSGAWLVWAAKDHALTNFEAGVGTNPDVVLTYASEEAAWLAAAVYCDEVRL